MKRKRLYANGLPYDDWIQEHLKTDKEFAIEFLKLSFESLSDPAERGGALLSIRAVAEACGGLGFVSRQAGVSRESLYRSLSPKGNPTLKTLLAVLAVVGARLSIASLEAATQLEELEGTGVANEGSSSVESRVA